MTPQDFEQLSAYLDNQLSQAEKAKVEVRLGREPDLQKTLADLRLTRQMLRSLPTVRPPRNFTLTRAQAQATSRPRLQLFPALRLATALAGFAFVFLLAVDLFGLQNQAGGTAGAPMESALKSTEPTATVQTSAASGAEAMTVAPPAVSQLTAETPTPAAEINIAAADVSATPTPDPAASRSALASAPTETPLALAYDVTATEEDVTFYATGADERATPNPVWLTVRYFEIGLGILTLLLAVAAWWWRNR